MRVPAKLESQVLEFPVRVLDGSFTLQYSAHHDVVRAWIELEIVKFAKLVSSRLRKICH